MSVMTVRGAIAKEKIGMALPHEHIYIDLRGLVEPDERALNRKLWDEKVHIKNLDRLSRNPYAVRDNLVLDDEDIAEEELLHAIYAGYNTIVDVTNIGIARDAVALRRMAYKLDANIVAGCGFYVNATLPDWINAASVDEISEHIFRDLTVGMDGTDIKAGVIGEVGTSQIVYPNEEKVLIASAMAQRKTGVGMMVHTYPFGKTGHAALDILERQQVDFKKVCIAHVDVVLDLDYIYSLLKRGVYIEFDNFGKEYYTDKRNGNFAPTRFVTDFERITVLKKLILEGYASQILLSCDVCLKTLLHNYGGWGYDHVKTNIVPILVDEGVSDRDINTIMEKNTQDFLDVRVL